MNFDIIKESCVEYCRNTYALGVNYFSKCYNRELKKLLDDILVIEDDIRKCYDVNDLFNYKYKLEGIVNRIEVIINA